MSAKRQLKRIIPPALMDAWTGYAGHRNTFEGPWPTWADAQSRSRGYDAEAILDRVSSATEAVVSGRAAYERDGVLFQQIEHSFPLLAALLRAAGSNDGDLAVLDFGGSLGSSYRECRPFLRGAVRQLHWCVVEQSRFVERGGLRFASPELQFFESIDEAAAAFAPQVVLLSGVLQYLPEPMQCIRDVLRCAAPLVVIDRTIVNGRPDSAIYVQHVPASIYDASYPAWSLSERRLIESFADDYGLLSAFDSLPFPGLSSIGSQFRGYIFEKKQNR